MIIHYSILTFILGSPCKYEIHSHKGFVKNNQTKSPTTAQKVLKVGL